ncbi:MAG: hydantoinase B/oxoprolinase family protein [Thioalkalispiraceae bacterium]|jgi:N-methylhydantoinase B
MNPVELSIFSNRINAVCDEMGAVLQRAAFSPNIRDRLDFSCAVFDSEAELCAQAAHIPVHLGSMAYAMRDIVEQLEWAPGDMVVVNDPFLGGTHLPDVTLISPVFVEEQLQGFVANRAHHADIGGHSPGSMPISKTLEEEGIIIPPQYLVKGGETNYELMDRIVGVTRNKTIGEGDFAAQISANRTGIQRLAKLIEQFGIMHYQELLDALNNYAHTIALQMIKSIPDGEYQFADLMDDDGLGNKDLKIQLALTIRDDQVCADFTGTAEQTVGNINCPLSVVAAAVYYVFRCLMPDYTPACAGSFRPITITAPSGCLLNAKRPAAVAAGNVETSTRVVDVVMGALAQAIPDKIPAASHGSMNNLAMGGSNNNNQWDYYETIGGGMGAGQHTDGLSGVQTHMTNTRNTPVEVMESTYPVRVQRYALRHDSGGDGLYRGGNGLIREFEFTDAATVTLLSERRRHHPWGLNGGKDGMTGLNKINNKVMPAKFSRQVQKGDHLTIETAGGGGWGKANNNVSN